MTAREPATSRLPPFAPDVDVAVNVDVAGIVASMERFVAFSVAVPSTMAELVISVILTATAIPTPVDEVVTAVASASADVSFFEVALTVWSPVVVMVRPALEMWASVGPSR